MHARSKYGLRVWVRKPFDVDRGVPRNTAKHYRMHDCCRPSRISNLFCREVPGLDQEQAQLVEIDVLHLGK